MFELIEWYRTYKQKGEEIKKNDGLQKLNSNPEIKNLLPKDYVQFREKWEKTNEPVEGEKKKVRGWKRGKDLERGKIKELKKQMKMPKEVRNVSRKYIQSVKGKLKKLHRKVRARTDKDGKDGKDGKQKSKK